MHGRRSPSAIALVLLGGGLLFGQETTRVSVDSNGAEADWFSGGSKISADGRVVAFASNASNLVGGDTNGAFDVFVHDRSTGVTERVSVDSSGNEGSGDNPYFDAPQIAISADGQIIAFSSQAPDLVANDTNSTWDVFVHDRSTGVTERVSLDSSGVQANDASFRLGLKADGSIVAFDSLASNLVTGDTNGFPDIFVHERATGITTRVSVDTVGTEANDWSLSPAISADGNLVTFRSLAWNLVSGDTNGTWDIFVHDRGTGTTERVSVDSAGVQANNNSDGPVISADGRVVAFSSRASNLVSSDLNGRLDVFVHDRSSGITERVSVDSSGNEGDKDSGAIGGLAVSISADGRFIAFVSSATNLVPNDLNRYYDVFFRDRIQGVTERVSVDSAGVEGNGSSGGCSLSSNGQLVAFASIASNFVANDTNGETDVFVRNRCDALWSNYGTGFAGTNGVPTLVALNDPVLGTKVTIDVGNSYGQPTFGVLLVGDQSTDVPTNRGGDLLVLMTFLLPLGFSSSSGLQVDGDLPDDDSLCGESIYLQALEIDPGASKRLSFTAGLELILGR